MSSEITIKVKQTSNNQVIDVVVDTSASVLDFKKLIQEKSQIEPELQNLIFKGKILADEKLISDYKIEDQFSVILVKKVKQGETKPKEQASSEPTNTAQSNTQSNPQTNPFGANPFGANPFGAGGMPAGSNPFGAGGMPGGMPDMGQMNQMMQNPMYQEMMKNVCF